MGYDLKPFYVALLLLRICEYAVVSTVSFALLNCKDHCRNVSVPYPFGIGQGCYKEKRFEIVCRYSSEKLFVPFLLSIEKEVISFSLGGSSPSVEHNRFYILSPLKHSGCSLLRPQEVRMLGAYFLVAMRNDRLHEILDAHIKEECDHEEVLAVAKLARRCLSLNSEHRPTIKDVFIELDRMQSKKKGAQSQAQNGEEQTHIQIAILESMSLSYSSPYTLLENSSFSLDSKPLMTHKTQ